VDERDALVAEQVHLASERERVIAEQHRIIIEGQLNDREYDRLNAAQARNNAEWDRSTAEVRLISSRQAGVLAAILEYDRLHIAEVPRGVAS